MLLTDAVHAIETVGGVCLGISAVAFILLGLFVEIFAEICGRRRRRKARRAREVQRSLYSQSATRPRGQNREGDQLQRKLQRVKPPKVAEGGLSTAAPDLALA